MYMDKINIDDISDELSNETIQNILSLIFGNNKINSLKVNKRLVGNTL